MSVTLSTEQKRIKEWTAALRSGEYAQCKATLHDDIGYCCLGVGTDLYHKETGKGRWTEHNSFQYGGADETSYFENAAFPTEVHYWFGLVHSNPPIRIVFNDPDIRHVESNEVWEWTTGDKIPSGMSFSEENGNFVSDFTLAELNDIGFTFAQIADVIDYFFADPTPVDRNASGWSNITRSTYTTLAAQEASK